ncbi:MAG: DUF3093 domain-containing protein [Propionibacteriales bacterium]|nr:DUF3093 domain-containing protein [Propionibacteriales bacterium]
MQASSGDYDETLTPPLSWWVMALGLVAAVWWCFWVAAPEWVAWIAGAVTTVAVATMLVRFGTLRLVVDDNGLRAGDAALPWQHVGSVDVLDAEQTHALLGVDADATAHLAVRSYSGGAVKVVVDDERDPTPYWVISTRHGDELALHLRSRSMQD